MVDQVFNDMFQDFEVKMAIPRKALTDKALFIKTARNGVSGETAKAFADEIGDRLILSRILGVSLPNVSRVFQQKKLEIRRSEDLLDSMRIMAYASAVMESKSKAKEWLHSRVPALNGERPVDLFDTSEGRAWVYQTLKFIECGEFS